MAKITIRYEAGVNQRFVPSSFAEQIGKEIPLTVGGLGGPPVGMGKLVTVEIVEDGAAALLTVEVPDEAGERLAPPLGSFSIRREGER